MSVPWPCPVCNGTGRVLRYEPKSSASGPDSVICHACDGKGIAWEPNENTTVVEPVYQQDAHAS